ncbi:uncharacterized protein [Ptychodera flava]|uniref:uncharacterized protein isoform X3 n=1 Tax=Ptychodera flava TaxID=63121 RepID=UPI00396A8338
MAGIETGQSCQRQHNPSTQTDPRGSFESRSNAFDTEQPNSPRQATVEVSSDQTESDIDASGNTFEPISTNESRSDSFTQKLCGLAQEITDAELGELKHLCNDKFTRRKLDSLSHPCHLFFALRDKNLISESNTGLVEDMLCKIGRNALIEKHFKSSTDQVTEISPNPGVTEAGQCNPPSMIPTNFESRSHLSQQTTDVSALAKLLKDKYKRHYSKLLPIPWNDEIHLNLHEVYTTLEVKKVKGVTHKMGEALENLHDMFKSSDDRRIRIEGAPAMGKSTLCRKLAYDWSCELNANLKKMHEKLQSLDTNCENMRKAFTPFKKFYPDCIKFLFESKYSKALITSFDVLRHESLVYTHGEPVLICRRNLFISDLKYQTHIKLDEKHCSFQNFLRLLQLISKTSMPLDTLCVLGSQIKKINSCLEILNGNPIHMKSLIIHSTTKWTRTDTDNLAGIITNFRGENISLSLNVDEGNGGSNSWLNNIIERIKENTSVKCFKFQANQSEDILQSMAQNGTQEIVYMDHSWSLKAASVNAVSTFLKNCDTTESFKVCIHHNDRSDLILNIKSALMRISPSLKSLHLLFTHHELCNALSANMTLNDIGMAISNETYESVFSVIKQNKYAKSMTIYDNYNFHGIDERWQSIAAALRENKVLKHLKIETMDDDDVLTAMNSLLIPVSKEIETNQVTLDSMTLRAFIEQNSSGCTGLQSIVSKQEKPDNWYHQVYPSVNSAYHYHLIRYTS